MRCLGSTTHVIFSGALVDAYAYAKAAENGSDDVRALAMNDDVGTDADEKVK